MKLSNEAKIGILVFAVILILAVLTLKVANFSLIPNGYHIRVRFLDVQGLTKNAPVTLNGFEEGRVSDVKIIYEGEIPQVELTLWLKAEARVPHNAKAFVRMMGFMGEKYVAIEMKDAKDGYLPQDSIIQGEEPSSLEKLLSEGQIIAQNVKEITESINKHLQVNHDNIDMIFADVRSMAHNLNSITTNVDERIKVNSRLIDDIVTHFDSTAENLDEMSYDLKLNPWKLLYKPRKERRDLLRGFHMNKLPPCCEKVSEQTGK